MPRSRYHIVGTQSPHFMTATVNHWLPIFTRPDTVNIVLDSWRYLQREAGFILYGYVILENHLHLIAASADLGRDMRRFKSYTARAIINWLEQRHSAKSWKCWLCLCSIIKPNPPTGLGRRKPSPDY